jgi:hypothetical protein
MKYFLSLFALIVLTSTSGCATRGVGVRFEIEPNTGSREADYMISLTAFIAEQVLFWHGHKH